MLEQTKVPQIRFKGFSDQWGEKTFGDLLPITSAARVHKNEWTKSGVPFFRSSDVVANYKGNENAKAFISFELYKELTGKIGRVEKGDILVTGGGSIGIPYLVSSDDPLYFKDADLLWLKVRENINSHYLYTYFSAQLFRRYLKSISHIGTIAHYTVEQAKSTPIGIPRNIDEQFKIGTYFQKLGEMIELHQRKHEKLLMLKKAMLKKMFPQDGATTPEVRFKGFFDPWEEKKLGEIMTNISNNTLSRAELNYKSGLAKNVHYGDILIKFGEILNVNIDEIPYVSSGDLASKLKPSMLQDGDIIIADAAEDESVGKCTEIVNVGDEIVLAGLHTIALRPIVSFAPMYLGYLMNSPTYHDQLLRLMQGTKVLSISKSVIKHTSIFLPKDETEQKKIGSYFRQLDELIAQHGAQLTKLKQIKNACLEKMFV